MNDGSTSPYVTVQDLRIGMHVHLDLGWLDHPFALNSFRIGSQAQIDTLRSLGVERVRWDPLRSDPAVLSAWRAARRPASGPAGGEAAEEAEARRQRRELLAAQAASLARCERYYAQATRTFRQALDQVHARPDEAREASQALIRGFLDAMEGTHDNCIRLLSEGAGDRAGCHSVNVTVISLLLGRAIRLPDAELLELGVGALLHDIGKIDLPDRVRVKDEHFTLAEFQYYQEHLARGVELARRMQLGPGATLVIGQHHEHADGSGFPQRLPGERIHRLARIVAMVNRYDNLCNPLNPLKALTPHEALSLMFAQMKSRFDEALLNSFIRLMGVYPPGSVVQLTDDRHAMVVSVNAARPLKPRVLVHDVRVPREEALVLDLEQEPALGIRRSFKPQQLPKAALDYLSPRPRMCYFFERARDVEGGQGKGLLA
ncbi:HD-GYP domain-containing protein [Caldimonas thermodepolymerans]|nr:HD-GYP domain-containing protein [Caldimonas thermodepolymerans]UZG42905.1 DUF3391 domain-containing protein [Caldimonas thermodepolymerans]UZG46570.1 DUF3391 domain-containing protein [Caldimonas thermodepolymerans]